MCAPRSEERDPADGRDPDAAASASSPPSDPAFWDALGFELGCPRCGYNLRMLPAPRCPECGLEFDWGEVLSAARGRHEFLFEHNWRTRPVWSLGQTLWRSLRPLAFWRSVSIYERINVPALLVVALVGFAALPLAVIVSGAVTCLAVGLLLDHTALSQTAAGAELAAFHYDYVSVVLWYRGIDRLITIGLPFAFIWWLGTFLLLSALQQTLGRCKVRLAQLLRVLACSVFGPAVLLGALVVPMAAAATAVAAVAYSAATPGWAPGVPLALALAAVGVPGAFVAAGLRHYLHLPRPRLLAMVAALVGRLLAVTVTMVQFVAIARG